MRFTYVYSTLHTIMKSNTQTHIEIESELPIEDIEIYLEKAYEVATVRPLDEKAVQCLKKLSTFLWQRYQISRVECSKLQQNVSEELWVNSERLRTLTFLRRDEKKLQDRLQKNHWLLERVKERGRTHIRVAKEAQNLKRDVDEQKEDINQLKKEINRLNKKCDRLHHQHSHH